MPPVLLFLISASVFSIGLIIVFTKRNVLFILIGVELMLNAACFNFILFSSYDPMQQGQVFFLVIMAMITCETAVALAIIFNVYQHYQNIEVGQLRRLREK